jgi:hypothetical protein
MEETKRIAQDNIRRMGRGESEFESATRSFAEASRGFQAIALEVTNHSRKSFDDVLKAWEQLLSARSLPDVIDIQTRYARKTYNSYFSELSKLTDLYLDLTRNVVAPVETITKRFP